MIKLGTQSVISFGFRGKKTHNFSYQLRAIFFFWINLLNTRDRKKYFYCGLWFVGILGNQAWHKFCYVWFQLVCHECLGQ